MSRIAVVTGAGRGFGAEIALRLAGRGYDVLCTDVDGAAAGRTAERVGGFAMTHDVRDPGAHRDVARAALARGPLEVWVNNAGILRTAKAWEHTDEEIWLLVEVNLLGVVHGSRAAVDAMRAGPAEGGPPGRHIINIASLSALAPVPGLAVYGATKHAVLGFTTSLQADLRLAGSPLTVHAVCPDSADTEMVRERSDEEEASMIFSAPRMLSAAEVADRTVALLDSRELVAVIPRWRGWVARSAAMAGRHAMPLLGPMRSQGRRRRARAR